MLGLLEAWEWVVVLLQDVAWSGVWLRGKSREAEELRAEYAAQVEIM